MQLPGKSPTNIIHGEDPLNLESPPGSLADNFVTPSSLFFVRTHGSVPEVDAGRYSLTISGLAERPMILTLQEIKERPRKELTATLHCAGNRRAELMEHRPIPGETPWGVGAIGNARWAGASLRDLLREAGAQNAARHVAFTGLDEVNPDGQTTRFGGSIPLHKALEPDVLLAYEMNGEPLSAEHGFPLRAVVPGYIGARSVKWLSSMELRSIPSVNHYQSNDYKLYPKDAEPGESHPSEGEALGDLCVNSAICRPAEGQTVASGRISVAGYAITGGGREIERVEVSADGGKTWTQATLKEGGEEPRAWRLWEAEPKPAEAQEWIRLAVRARDTSGEIQPDSVERTWNPKGYVNNAYHRVNVRRAEA